MRDRGDTDAILGWTRGEVTMGVMATVGVIRPTLRERERDRERGWRTDGDALLLLLRWFGFPEGELGTPTDCMMVKRSFREMRVELFT